jgi:peptidase M28-like protein
MRGIGVFLLFLASAPLSAQMAAPLHRAAASITEADVKRRVGIIADDSMMGRDTPSRGLDLTARYVADQFRHFGLQPAGDDGTWFVRYPVTRRRLDRASSKVVFRVGSDSVTATFDRSARQERGTVPTGPVSASTVLVGGTLGPGDVKQLAVRDKIVLLALDYARQNPETLTQVARALRLAAPKAVVQPLETDSATFAAGIPRHAPVQTGVDLNLVSPPFVAVPRSVLASLLPKAGVNLREITASPTPVFRELPSLAVRLEMKDSILSRVMAPLTVGLLEGTDPRLKHEYLLFSAHMDHIGITPGRPDSINNGADDDGSGTVGVIELAEAFSRAGARPKRSLLFLTVSGEEKGLWGSRYFSEHPTVPLFQVVADLNMDMIGRNWPDTIVAIGKEHSDLGATLNRVNAAHPELGMTAIDDIWPEEQFYFRSDHYNFARKGVPILFFFNGVHPDYHQVTDSPDKINGEKEARVLRLIFYLGQEIANAPERPKWNPESYKEIVEEDGS